MDKIPIVYVDGENFLHRIEEVLKAHQLIERKDEITKFGVKKLIYGLFPEFNEMEIRYYGTKIRTYDIHDTATHERAELMVESQRRFKRDLERQGILFITAGSLRVREVLCRHCQTQSLAFKEKGVDVRIALDIANEANEKQEQIVISSDSDILPAMRMAAQKQANTWYVYYEEQPNLAMMNSAHASRAFSAAKVLELWNEVKDSNE